jgi:DNA-binding MarR family transcriptional regulator
VGTKNRPGVANRDDELAGAWHELMARYHRITCVLDRELSARHDLTISEFEVLQQLQAAEDGSMRMFELGENAHLTQSALSRLISRLEQDGLVERGMCVEDRRSVWAKITPAGARRYTEAKPTQRTVLRDQAAGECIAQSTEAFQAVASR